MNTLSPARICLLLLLSLFLAGRIEAQASQDSLIPVFLVNTTDDGDDGVCDQTHCSFREAITLSNADPEFQSILFQIGTGQDVQTIAPLTPLPDITDTTAIDGTSQGCVSTRCIILDGVNIAASFTDGLTFRSPSNYIAGFVIHRFTGGNIDIGGVSNDDNFVDNCYLGTDESGSVGMGGSFGILLNSGNNTLQNSLVSGNSGTGVLVQGANNMILDNIIGTDPNNTISLGAGKGVQLQNFSGSKVEGNVIAYNGLGVRVQGATATGMEITKNSFFNNGIIGIDLNLDGPTANDIDDADTGPNNLQNYPEISIARKYDPDGPAGEMSVSYLVPSASSNSSYPIRVEFYIADSDAEEGMTFIGEALYEETDYPSETTDYFVPTQALSGTETLVAIAIDDEGNTSEFSPAYKMGFVINSAQDFGDGTCDASECTIAEAIDLANATPGAQELVFDINGGGSFQSITVSDDLPSITSTVFLDGASQGCPELRCIELNGIESEGATGDGLRFQSHANSLVRNLVINRFPGYGLLLFVNAKDLVIENNFIGTSSSGNAILGGEIASVKGVRVLDPDASYGEQDLRLQGGFGNNIGLSLNHSSVSGVVIRDNVISGNQSYGMIIRGSGNSIVNNSIGTDLTGIIALPNASGIFIEGFSQVVEGNIIRFNNSRGVLPYGLSSGNVRVSKNAFGSNAGLAIDINFNNVSPNDPGDADTGMNNVQNYPDLMEIGPADLSQPGSQSSLSFSISTDPANATYPLAVELYLADPDGEEGMTYLGEVSYLASDYPNVVTRSFTPLVSLPIMEEVVAITIDADGNTSEFSPSISVSLVGDLVYWIDGIKQTVNRGLRDNPEIFEVLFDNPNDGVGVGGAFGEGLEIEEKGGKIYWSEGGRIVRGNMDGSGTIEVLYDGSDGLVYVYGIALDPGQEDLYWIETSPGKINRGSMDGSGVVEDVVGAGISSPRALELDIASRMIYWSNATQGIRRRSLSGGSIEIINAQSQVRDIELDIANGMIYWVNNISNSVHRAPLHHADNVETLFDAANDGVSSPVYLRLDKENEQIYWTEFSNDRGIHRGNMDGSGTVEVLSSDLIGPGGLDGEWSKSDLIVHVKRPAAWGLPKISYATTTPDIGLIPSPGIAMVAVGCGWYSYTFRGANSVEDIVVSGYPADPAPETVSFSVDSESWFEFSDPGSGNWNVIDQMGPPLDFQNCNEGFDISAGIALHGPYNSDTGDMNNDLQEAGLLPFWQPYNEASFQSNDMAYAGQESYIGTKAGFPEELVDWVLVELRTNADDPVSTVATRAGILRSDGNIRSPSSLSIFFPVPDGDYHVVVRHRNSLPIMLRFSLSATAGSTYGLSFLGPSIIYGSNARIQIESSPDRFAMRGGDGNGDLSISAFDFLNVWLPENGTSDVYSMADFNLDGSVTAFDFLNVFLPSNGQSSQIP